MKLRGFFLMISLYFALPLFPENDIYFSKIGMEQGVSQLSVMTIYQDELGVMWFGTREGVSRYNGNSMEIIKPVLNDTNSLHGSLVKMICGDRNGLVYIHSQNGVNEYNLRTGEIKSVQRDMTDAIAYGGNLWIAEQNRLYAYIQGEKKPYLELPATDAVIKAILQTSDQRIILGTLSSGVFIADQNKKIRSVIPATSQVSCLFEDNKQNIWAGTWQNGLFQIEKNGSVKNYMPDERNANSLSSAFVRAICQDNNNFLWIGTRKGLDRFSVEQNIFRHYESGDTKTKQLTNESVWSLFRDVQGTIWVGTYFGGVNYFNPEIDYYTFHDLQNGNLQNKAFPVISDIIQDKNKSLFLCTEGDGLIFYNPENKNYKIYRTDSRHTAGLTSDNIKTAYYDRNSDELWLGMHLGGVTHFDLKNGRFTGIPVLHDGWDQSDIVRAIVPYGDDLLIGTYNGLFRLNKKTKNVSLFSEKLHEKLSYFVDVKLQDDRIWIASRGLYRYNLKTGELQSFSNRFADTASLSNNNIMKILIDGKNRVWIGTNGGGVNLFDDSLQTFTCFSSANSGLVNDYISNLMESPYGYIYASTTRGLSILDPDTRKVYNYSTENGFPLNSLFNGGMCALPSGEIYVAGMNGMVSFFEENLSAPRRRFNINLINLWINNKLVTPGDESGVLEKALPYTKSIRLNHKQSMPTIEFASNNYIAANQLVYTYKLEGFSDAWTELPQGINKLNFMNLSPGTYNLRLEALSSADNSLMASTVLEIRVFPPFYRSLYAYLFYILLIAFIVWRYVLFTGSRLLLKTSLEYEKKEKEHIEKVNQSKLRFFTNISHEFRTPLTLIAGQIDMLLQTNTFQPAIYNRILNIKRNTLNMLNLINELLQFGKSEQGDLTIKVAQRDMVEFLYEVYLSFLEYSNFRNIKFGFETPEEKINIWFDPVQMQKVFYNLISNAFKYTPKGGTVNIRIEQTGEIVIVSVTDNGIGIGNEDLEKIFDRFYQAENGLQINDMSPGTGIGLSLTKSIIKAHHAAIRVESAKSTGTVFKIELKKGSTHFSEEQKAYPENADELCILGKDEQDVKFIDEIKNRQLASGNAEKPSMLIVEDHDELRLMLHQLFEPLYEVYTAVDGQEGLDMTIEYQPDIVLSDLMTPRMSGSEMCSKIKNNFLVCHIPVIILTAQTAIEYNIEGLRLGADDYIVKPFNIKTLITRCNNLVNNRRMLQEKFTKQTDFSARLVATNQLDREFLEKAQQVVEAHFDDSNFDVTVFSREMALGRTRLFTKLKGITGQTPNDFILNVKLKKAANLLNNHPEYNISDITYMLGFSSPKYFTKCFKDQFGLSPSAYRKGEETNDERDSDE